MGPPSTITVHLNVAVYKSRSKNRSYAHTKARLCPPLSIFWSDQLLDRLPAVCPTDLTPNSNVISTSQNSRGKYGAWKWRKAKSVFCKDQSLMYSKNFSTWLVDAWLMAFTLMCAMALEPRFPFFTNLPHGG